MRVQRVAGPILIVALQLALGLAGVARAQPAWFAPNDNIPRGANHDIVLNTDWPELFRPYPAWDAKIDVFLFNARMTVVGRPRR